MRELRTEIADETFAGTDAEVLVGGTTSENIDYFDSVIDPAPWVIALVLLLTFVFLTVVFRSVVVAGTAVALNLLSVGAAYGLLVLVFQEGIGADLLGFQTTDSIEAWVPLFLFSVLFGLSMDYQVFLLARIRERYDETGDTTDAVTYGVSSTARIITGAALIIVAVFAGFARGDLIMFQQMGFGVAVALLLDATVIRSVVLPSAMKLLGDVELVPAALARVAAAAERGRTGEGRQRLIPWYRRRVASKRRPRYEPSDALAAPRYTGVRTFGRCPLVDDPAGVDVAVLGIPFDTGTTNRPGARFGPEAVRSASIALRPYNAAQNVQVFGALSVADLGDVAVTPGNAERTTAQIAERLEPIVRTGTRTLCLGGDHTVVLGELRAHAAVHGPLGLVLLDAHADVWDGTSARRTTTALRFAVRSRRGCWTRAGRSSRGCAARSTARRTRRCPRSSASR